MIIDTLDNFERYLKMNSKFEKAFRFLTENKLENLDVGKHEIDGDEIYAIVQSYTTSLPDEKLWEAHKQYIDIQYIVAGRETIEWAPVDSLKILEVYSEEKDAAFLGEEVIWTSAQMKEGYFGVYYPEDAHKPGCIFETSGPVKKIVIKIKI